MAEFYPNPIRACRPLSSLFLYPRILFPKTFYRYNNFVGKSAVIRTLKQRTSFRILSKSEPDFGIISTAECSDGSVVFRFGIAKDEDDESVSGVDINKVVVGGDADTEGLVIENGEELSESLGPQSSLEQVQSHSEARERRYPAQISSEISSAVESVSNGLSGLSKSSTESSSVDEVSTYSDENVVVTRNTVPVVDILDKEVHSNGEENTALICEGSVLHELVSSDLSSVDEVSLDNDENVDVGINNVSQVDVQKEEVHSHIKENTTQICEDEAINGLASSVLDTTTDVSDDEDVVGAGNAAPQVDVLKEEVHGHIEEDTTAICEDVALNGSTSSELDTTTEKSDDEVVVGDRNIVPQVDVLKEEVHSHIEENTTAICEDVSLNGSASSELDTTTEKSDDEVVVGVRNIVPQVDVLKEEVHSHIEENTTAICGDVALNGSTSSVVDTTTEKSDDEVVVGARNIVPQVDVLKEEVHSHTEDNTTQICENEVLTVLVSSELVTATESDDPDTSPASNEESADVEVADLGTMGEDDVNLIEARIVSSAVQVQASLDEERSLSALDESVGENRNETALAIGSDVPSTNCKEERGSKLHSSSVAGEQIYDVVEPHSTEEATSREEISTTGLVLSTGAALLTHPSKAFIGAEDAYFVASQNWLGVADGVGQWSLEGINDGIYAGELMKNCERIVSNSKGTVVNKPEEVLVRSVAETQLPGSSTILVAYFDGQTFRVANIGDSGFIIIRHGVVFKWASSMVHGFNFPLHIEHGDNPTDLIEDYQIDLDEGDVIVTATDGLFDNLYEQEIASIVSKSLEAGSKPQEIAELLARRAQEVAQSSTPRTPFADAAKAAGYVGLTGGKLDDVIVIVSLVQNKSTS